ncbi:MAG: homocysteine S-methyltransferase family protein [Eubacteriales bacterium]|nr:homocysteine S-methyltransferase family protein [Eubacteriales bacterium]
MTKEAFRNLVKEGILFLDGATGSNLQKAGMPAGVCPELWVLEHPEALIELQRAYIEAGSRIVYAPTFSANRIKLREFGLEDRIGELNRSLVEISKKAAAGRALVAGDLTMTGEQLAPIGKLDFEELIGIYKEQIGYLAKAGADLLVVETMMSLQESRAALIAAKEVCPELAVMVTMTFEQDGRSLFGTDAATAAVVLSSLGADAVGANCSTGPDQMAGVIRRMAQVTDIPIIAKPNAGLPSLDGTGQTVYDMGPEEFGRDMTLLLEAGAGILGGCCGTTPEHIRSMTQLLAGKKPAERAAVDRRFLTSERSCLSFGLDDPFLIVGERINPTGKKKLQAQLREKNFDLVLQFAQEQEERGASILDINMGMSGIDEKAMMLQALEEVAGVTSLPLSIDSSHVEVQEEALRRYPGRALINSISLEKEKFEKLLPLAKKYGAMFVLLPLSDEGLPASLEEKISIIDRIVSRALELGLKKTDIVVDGLVTTVGANKKAALETLETIRYCRRQGLATTCGLSNISFGLPERSCVNTAFLTMAVLSGLTMAIANPSQDLLVGAAFASDLLLNREESDLRYIDFAEQYRQRTEQAERQREERLRRELAGAAGTPAGTGGIPGDAVSPAAGAGGPAGNAGAVRPGGADPAAGAGPAGAAAPDAAGEAARQMREAVLKGRKKNAEELTRQALAAGNEPSVLLNDYLLPAINQVGELFDKGKYFLPQLIASAETMKLCIGVLEPLLLDEKGGRQMPVVVIATVQGDIHDIGKNLVALMLKNYGFQVIDLGKDVPKEVIVETAIEKKAQIIALSALMTTTMQEMRHVIEYARRRGVTAKIMIGGAVITQEYADEIHADGYSRDAADAVKLAKRLVAEGAPDHEQR